MDQVNVEELKYNDLKAECARRGLDAKGTKSELSERLDRFQKGEEDNKVFVGEEDNVEESFEEIQVEDLGQEQSQNVIPNEDEAKQVEKENDWERIKNRLDIVFGGRVQFYLQENSPPSEGKPGNYSIVFKGTGKRSECVNLTAGEKVIIREAQKFCRPTAVYLHQGGDTPEQAIKRFEANMNGVR